MNANSSRTKIWKPQYLQSIELVHNVSKGCLLPRHFHEELELGIPQGEGLQLKYRGTMYDVPANSLLVIQPGEVHHTDRIQDYAFRGLRVGTDLLQQVAIEVAGYNTALPVFPIPFVHNHDFNAQIIQVYQALEQSTSQLEQQSFIQDFLAQLILSCAEDPPCLAELGQESQPVKRVQEYIEDRYNQEISLEQLAQIANMSSFHLNRAFCKKFGMPPHAYQIQVRILRAKRLLKKEKSIAKVATETGFASQSHFGSHFKRLACVTPKQYAQDSKNVIDFQA
jgi:AraC-like DNA-binding protein